LGGPDVDGRSDLYSLGALAYAMMTGRPPFEGNSLVETILKIRTGVPDKPKQFQMSIPDRFQAVVLKLLAKRPDERFQTAGELLKELERIGKFSGV
jgi:eukaryotic-like serine/threonine-protein kinase